jgi:hypothetical protein
MQTRNQRKSFSIIGLSIVAMLSISIFSCTKSNQLSSIDNPAEEFATSEANNGASTYQSQQTWTMDQKEWIPCANNGNGEYVQFEGYVHFTYVTTVNNNHFTLVTQINPNEVSGVGLTTGDKYVASGGSQEVYSGSFINGQSIAKGSAKFKFTGSGPGNNFSVVFIGKVIVNANGEVLHELPDIKSTCN